MRHDQYTNREIPDLITAGMTRTRTGTHDGGSPQQPGHGTKSLASARADKRFERHDTAHIQGLFQRADRLNARGIRTFVIACGPSGMTQTYASHGSVNVAGKIL